MRVSVSVCVCRSLCVCVRVRACVRACLCVSLSLYVSLSVYLSACVSLYVSLCVSVALSVCTIHVSIHTRYLCLSQGGVSDAISAHSQPADHTSRPQTRERLARSAKQRQGLLNLTRQGCPQLAIAHDDAPLRVGVRFRHQQNSGKFPRSHRGDRHRGVHAARDDEHGQR